MKIRTTIIAAMFGLLMMAMPNVASAEVVNGAGATTIAYYRPWACANPHYRHHHWWRCH